MPPIAALLPQLPVVAVLPCHRDLMLLSIGKGPFSAPGWVHEPKLDGFRALAFGGTPTRLLSRMGNDLAPAFPEVVEALAELDRDCVLDGELTCCDEAGPQWANVRTRSRMSRQTRIRAARAAMPATLYVFDVLIIDGGDVRGLPMIHRKALLSDLVAGGPHLRVVEHFDDGEALYAEIVRRRLEGIVSKRADSPYRAGRSENWLKVRAPGGREIRFK